MWRSFHSATGHAVADKRWTGALTALENPPPLAVGAVGFTDRHDAGRRLAALLARFGDARPVVVGIPRGGVPVAAEVARALGAPLDVALVRKIGAPQNREYGIGALAEEGVLVLNERVVRALGLSGGELRTLVARAEQELEESRVRYRGARPPVELADRTAILIDDGLATGSSARAAVRSLRRRGAARVILAVPVAAPAAADSLSDEADEVVCLRTPADLWAVGQWYQDFRPTEDDEVTALLDEGAATAGPAPAGAGPHLHRLSMPVQPEVSLGGELTVPPGARGVVLFAHGSGSGRLSPRNRAVAGALCDAGLATLLFDLLTRPEAAEPGNVFDISLLASRLAAASTWLRARKDVGSLPLGYFGASTGAAAALDAAAELGGDVGAVVSRGGRVDLAHDLGAVRAPTLLIVGGADRQVLELNREAQRRLSCPSELAIVPGATHLFAEPGAIEQVSRLAAGWFETHLRSV